MAMSDQEKPKANTEPDGPPWPHLVIGLIVAVVLGGSFVWGVGHVGEMIYEAIGTDKAPFVLVFLSVVTSGSYYHGNMVKRFDRLHHSVGELDRQLRELRSTIEEEIRKARDE